MKKHEKGVKTVFIELPRNINGEADGSENPAESFSKIKYPNDSPPYSEDLKLKKLDAIKSTIDDLEESLRLSRHLENEQSSRYFNLKTKKTSLEDELKDADKRNENMLNLFRGSVIDFDLDNVGDLPWDLRIEIQRTWHKKYDAMLDLAEQLKSEISVKDAILEERINQINEMEKKLLNLAENLIDREETLKNICTKYLALKVRKDEQIAELLSIIKDLRQANIVVCPCWKNRKKG